LKHNLHQNLMLHSIVTAADIQDRDGSASLLGTLFGQYPFFLKLYADGGYQGPEFSSSVKTVLSKVNVQIVKRGPGRGIRRAAQTLGGRENAGMAQPLPPRGQGIGKTSITRRGLFC
jgi:hypothetical protein